MLPGNAPAAAFSFQRQRRRSRESSGDLFASESSMLHLNPGWSRRCLLLLSLGAAATSAIAQCSAVWLPGPGVPGTNGIVRATVPWDADGPGPIAPVIVVAGDFTI